MSADTPCPVPSQRKKYMRVLTPDMALVAAKERVAL